MENCKRNDRVANEGSSVLLDINDGDRLVFARLSNAGTLKIGKKDCSLRPLIGCSFGSMFRVESGKDGLYLSPVSQYEEGNDTCDRDDIKVEEELKDNRALCDNNTAQNLTGEDIDTMRREGVTGDEIVEALIANSATFEKKTAFSQEKYRLRKQKKYAPKVLMRRPFARSICEAYFKKHPTRIGFLRIDTLSLLLSTANVTAFSDILVFDMVGGLVTGAVAERMGGSGYICNTYLGNSAHGMDIVRIFNFADQTCRRILRCSLDDLCSAHNVSCEQASQSEETAILESGTNEPPSLHESSNEVQNTEEDMLTPETRMLETPDGDDAVPVLKAPKSAKAGEKASEELIKCWKEKGFSSLIVAAPDVDPWIIVQKLLPLLSYSAPFVIYHQYLQPLATCMHNLQIEKMAIGLQISEPWLREYQVLPSRTHPCMQMSAFGGYILSGTKICGAHI